MWVRSLNLDITKKVIHRTLSSLLYLKVTSFFPQPPCRGTTACIAVAFLLDSLFSDAFWQTETCSCPALRIGKQQRGEAVVTIWQDTEAWWSITCFFSNMGLIILHIHVETFRLITLAVTTQTWQSWHKIAQNNPRKSESETETV